MFRADPRVAHDARLRNLEARLDVSLDRDRAISKFTQDQVAFNQRVLDELEQVWLTLARVGIGALVVVVAMATWMVAR